MGLHWLCVTSLLNMVIFYIYATIFCIKKYDNWPIVVKGTKFELQEGEAVLYAGCEQQHWRPGVYKGEGMAQVFFHYVNQNGPFSHHQYDNYTNQTNRQFSDEDLITLNKLKNEN